MAIRPVRLLTALQVWDFKKGIAVEPMSSETAGRKAQDVSSNE
jgi:hypothetical protein